MAERRADWSRTTDMIDVCSMEFRGFAIILNILMMSRGDKPPQAHQQDLGDVEDIDRLFGDIDWPTANFTALEAQWRAELAAIEKVSRIVVSSHRCVCVCRIMWGRCWRVRRGARASFQRSMGPLGRWPVWRVSLWTTTASSK